jgi:ketosteroid isomerase-like protein
MNGVEAELNELEQRLIRAWVEQDRDTVDSILDDDWSVIDPAAQIIDKQQVLRELETGHRKIETGTIDQVRIRAFDNFAVVTGRTTATGNYEGNSFSVQLRFTDICVKRGGNWQVIASQATLIAQ